MSNIDRLLGRDVTVESGPHQGISGRVVYLRNYGDEGREPEPWAIVEYLGRNCFDETYTDQVSVPVRRTNAKRLLGE